MSTRDTVIISAIGAAAGAVLCWLFLRLPDVAATLILAVACLGISVALMLWRAYGFGRAIVTGLYWVANRLMRAAHAADQARFTWAERVPDDEQPTPELVIRDVREGRPRDGG